MTRTHTTARLAALALCGLLAWAPPTSSAAQDGPLGSPIPGQPLGTPLDGVEPGPVSFLAHQLMFPRVTAARDSADGRLRVAFAEKGVAYPAQEIFLRVFKHERELEVWARSHPDAPFTLVRSYPICTLPGQLGPKRRLGDLQVPEGFYYIDEFNPRSDFHLSLRVNYPNTADRLRRSALALGGDIYIHGGCATVGCVPIEDPNIEELYWLAAQATEAGQRLIPVHIFPARLDEAGLRWLEDTFDPAPDLLAFWRNLADGYGFFERTRRVPWITVAENGRYAVPERPVLAGDTLPAPAPPTDSIPAPAVKLEATGGAGGADEGAAAAGAGTAGAGAPPVR
jgi:murein L,D-transpeptidase YafK